MNNTRFVIIPAYAFAVLHCQGKKYIVNSLDSFITKEKIMGELIEYTFHKNYKRESDSVFEALLKDEKPDFSFEDIIDIEWLFAPEKVLNKKDWDEMILENSKGMIEKEELTIYNIISYLKNINTEYHSLIELASSHGSLLKKLFDINKHAAYQGVENSKSMISYAKEALPEATFINSDIFDLNNIQADYIVSRAFSHFVFKVNDIFSILEKLNSSVSKNSILIMHSTSPPLLNVKHLSTLGDIKKTTYVDKDFVTPFYVIEKS